MATFTYSTAANVNNPVWYGSITSKTATSVTWSNATYSTVFSGIFAYNAQNKIIGSTINGFQETIGGVLHMTATGLSVGLNSKTSWTLSQQTAFKSKFFAGNDSITGSSQSDLLQGFGGNDTVHGGDGNDTIYSADFDFITGGNGDDVLYAGGYATVNGGNGDDTYYATSGAAKYVEAANGGTDTVYSKYSVTIGDHVENLILTDKTKASGVGGATNNSITGNISHNLLMGMGGNDTLNGGAGNDTLGGGAGHDTLIGGVGNDVFYFDAPRNAATNVDLISDFSRTGGNTDKIHLAYSHFPVGGGGGHGLTKFDFWDTTLTPAGSNYRITYNKNTGVLSYDADGAGAIAPVQIAVVGSTTHPTLLFTDFYISFG